MSEDFLAKVVIEGEDRSASAALKKTAGAADTAGSSFKKLNEPIEGVRNAMNALGVGSNTAAGSLGQLAQGFASVGGKAGLLGAGVTAAAFAVNAFVEHSAKVDAADKQFAAMAGTFAVTREEIDRAARAWANHGSELDRGGVQKLVAAGREAGLTTAEVTNLGAEAERIARTSGVSFEEGLNKALANAKDNARKAGDALKDLLDKTERAERVGREGVLGVATAEAVDESKKKIDELKAKLGELAGAREAAKAAGTREAMGTLTGLHAEELSATQALAEEEQRLARIRSGSTKAKGGELDKEERAARAESIAEEAEGYKKSVELAKRAAEEKAEIAQALWDADIERIREKAKLEKLAADADYENTYGIRNSLDEQFAKLDADAKKKAGDDLKERTRLEKEAAKESARAHKEALRQREEEMRQAASNIVSTAQAAAQAIGALKSKDSSGGQKLGALLGLAGTVASIIPGGQPVGAGLLGAGAIASQFHAGGMVTAHAGTYLRGGRNGTTPVSALEGEGVVDRDTMGLLGGSRALPRIRDMARGGSGGVNVSMGAVTLNLSGSAPAHRDHAVRLLREALPIAFKGAFSAEEKRLAALTGTRPSR